MAPRRQDHFQRVKDEAPLGKPGMRNAQLLLPDDQPTEQQQVTIENARPPAPGNPATEGPLGCLEQHQQRCRCPVPAAEHDRVGEAPLARTHRRSFDHPRLPERIKPVGGKKGGRGQHDLARRTVADMPAIGPKTDRH